MKGKIIVLILMLFTLSGCDATYKLEYVNEYFNESLKVNNVSGYEEQIRDFYNVDISTNYEDVIDYSKEDGLLHGYTYYEKSLNEENGLSLKYSYNFSKEDYNHSFIGKNVFPNLSFANNSLYSGSISDIYDRYPALNNITIEFSTDKFVSYNNADEVINNTYYWYLTKENYNDKRIEIILNEETERDVFEVLEEETENLDDDEIGKYLKYIFIGIGIILLIGGFYVCIKFMNSNKK